MMILCCADGGERFTGPRDCFLGKEHNMLATLKRFWSDEQGLETVEYAVMTALIVAAMVGAITALRGAIVGRFNAVQQVVADAQ